MKKTLERIRHISFVFSMCLFLFNILSCGIDSITVIDEPVNTRHTPLYSNTDYAEAYFEFWTNEVNAGNYGDCHFLGTEVYYKIYTDASSMNSEKNNLVSTANSDTSSATAPTKMIDSYGYRALKVTNQVKNTLIPSTGKNQRVYIRLTDYQNIPDFAARIVLDGESNLTGTDQVNVPIRNNNSEVLSFNFGRSSANSELNKVPVEGDLDVKFSSSTTDGKWYVVLFAVGVGQDNTYTKMYSNILYLGDVTIDSNSFDN